MANFNKIFLMGNLTRDPQLSYLPSNTPVVEFGLAVNRRFRKSDGEQGEETLYVDCRSFGRPAEVINQYMQKGRPIFVEGRLQLDQWEDREGNKRSKHRVFVENFQFLEGGGGGGGGGGGQRGEGGGGYRDDAGDYGGGAPRGGGAPAGQPGPGNAPAGPPTGDASGPGDDDIPF